MSLPNTSFKFVSTNQSRCTRFFAYVSLTLPSFLLALFSGPLKHNDSSGILSFLFFAFLRSVGPIIVLYRHVLVLHQYPFLNCCYYTPHTYLILLTRVYSLFSYYLVQTKLTPPFIPPLSLFSSSVRCAQSYLQLKQNHSTNIIISKHTHPTPQPPLLKKTLDSLEFWRMADRKGGCCIARWGVGQVAEGGYNTSKMDMIMLKFRPIAPKPVSGTAAVSGTSESGSGSGGGGRHAKAGPGGRGRRKSTSKDNNSCSSNINNNRRCNNANNGKKRKSSSPDHQKHDDNHDQGILINNQVDQKADPTLLPLFPEAPDLSPTSSYCEHNHHHQVHDNDSNIVEQPFWVKFDKIGFGSNPEIEGNYSHCHESWW